MIPRKGEKQGLLTDVLALHRVCLSVMHCIKTWCLLSLYQALIHRLAFSIPLDAKSNLTVADDLQRTET